MRASYSAGMLALSVIAAGVVVGTEWGSQGVATLFTGLGCVFWMQAYFYELNREEGDDE